MEFRELAEEFLRQLPLLRKAGPHRHISESMRGEAFMLQYLFFKGESVPPGEISKSMRISSARMAAALKSLEKKGLICRRIDEHDRRRILVDLTQEGHAYAKRESQFLVETTMRLLSLLGDEDAREYVRLTKKLAELSQDLFTNENTGCGLSGRPSEYFPSGDGPNCSEE